MSVDEDVAKADPSPRTPRSPVIRALRGAGEEVQLGLTLEAVCRDPAVAGALAQAVIEKAVRGNPTARRRARRESGRVICMGEQRLDARVPRRMAKTRAAGRVDLRFVGERNWKLGVELKLNSGFGNKQLQRYASWGPVAAVARSLGQVEDLESLTDDECWVGVATWGSLLPNLRALPISKDWSRDWQSLLDVMEDDGDFDEIKPQPREVRAQVELLMRIAPQILVHFSSRLADLYGDSAESLALKATKVRGSRTWTSFGISAFDGPWLWFGVRNLWSRAPLIWVDYYCLQDWRANASWPVPIAKFSAPTSCLATATIAMRDPTTSWLTLRRHLPRRSSWLHRQNRCLGARPGL